MSERTVRQQTTHAISQQSARINQRIPRQFQFITGKTETATQYWIAKAGHCFNSVNRFLPQRGQNLSGAFFISALTFLPNKQGVSNMKSYMLAFSLLLFTAVAGLAQSQSQPSTPQTGRQEGQQAAKSVSGEITAVDTTKNELALKDATGKEMRLTADSSTKITREGKTITLAELNTNEKVNVEYQDSASGMLAKSIEVAGVKAKK
jgi:hypothetical protein